MNNAKKILRALVMSGRVCGGIYRGGCYQNASVQEGTLKIQKEYFVTFREVGYISADVVVKTVEGELAYFYEL